LAFRLEPGETVGTGTRRILQERVEQIKSDLSNQQIDRNFRVHESRKNCKRIRATYRLIRDEIGAQIYRQENARFRDIARQLAIARDRWVMIQTLGRLMDQDDHKHTNQFILQLRENLKQNYEHLMAQESEHTFRDQTIFESLEEALTQIKLLPFDRQDFGAIRKGIRRVYARGRKAMWKAKQQTSSEAFHDWRKRVKYLWHQVEILEITWPPIMKAYGDELHLLSDYLGDDHDLAVLRASLSETSSKLTPDATDLSLDDLIEQKRSNLERFAFSLGERLYHDSPRIFVKRLEKYWYACQKDYVNSAGYEN
jgi:CHAD domain-containing protein